MIGGFELTKDFIQLENRATNWEEAIKKSSKPLLEGGFIKESYVDAMINSVKEHGPYIVIAPNIGLPHARPETGSKKVGFSILRLDEPVAFSDQEEHKVRLLISLSCVDSTTHLQILQAIVAILSDEEKHDRIFDAKTPEEILNIFH